MIQPISVFGDLASNTLNAINRVWMPKFTAAWGWTGELTTAQPAGAWALWLLDREADIAGDLAYHTTVNNTPVMEIFLPTILRYGESLCKCITHEIGEAGADPTAAKVIPWPNGNIVYECCDPVSNDEMPLTDGLVGSNFVYPNWFNQGSTGPWDAMGLCQAAGEVRPGGYVEQEINGQWQMTAMRADGRHNWRLLHPGRNTYRANQ